jgi:hypothetical protein
MHKEEYLAPLVLVLSVSRTGDRKSKDRGRVIHHYKTCIEIMSHENS